MNVKILGRLCRSGKVIPFYTFKIPAGFPNPAADHIGNRPGKSSSVAGSIVLRDCATMKLSPQCRSGTAGHHQPSQTRSKHFLVLSTIETLEIPFKRCWIT
ncbi:hypothetical protein ALQ53_200249 [Pseudomonas cannabina]|uniref:Uncharacterized protein n=1 Tax=Pseudomonas cannabina TaxID=86840 RepID=A0AB37Q3C1_PSECA|nr:hypothetical protein ALQ53_200249 [Pseudomonas cannabina]